MGRASTFAGKTHTSPTRVRGYDGPGPAGYSPEMLNQNSEHSLSPRATIGREVRRSPISKTNVAIAKIGQVDLSGSQQNSIRKLKPSFSIGSASRTA